MQPSNHRPSEYPDTGSYRLPTGGKKRLKAVLRPGEIAAVVVRHAVMALIERRERGKGRKKP